MEFTFEPTSLSITSISADCLIVGVYEDHNLTPSCKELDKLSRGFISKIISRGDLEGKVGETLLLPELKGVTDEKVLLVGLGKKDKLDPRQYGKMIEKTISNLQSFNAKSAAWFLTEAKVTGQDLSWQTQQIVKKLGELFYRFDEYKSKPNNKKIKLKKIHLFIPKAQQVKAIKQSLKQAEAITKGMNLTKDLGNAPSNICTPSYIAKKAQSLAKEHTSIKCKILNEQEMKKLGMGALLAVSQGSKEPGKFIQLHYQGTKKKMKPVVLIGKGVTFDTGGISIKPALGLEEMKYDMLGAASVLGTFKAVASLKLPIHLIGLIPSVENMPGGQAYKPGDIVKSLSGQTIEIINTDAEGRLILCDAITYSQRFKPDTIIDIATLTGACIIALGHEASALLTHHDKLADDLIKAGIDVGDRAWRLPLWDEYNELLESNFADMKNLGNRVAGTIVGACFLGRFAKDMQWAHLDVAGTAMPSGNSKSATGRPVPLLVQYLLNRC